MASESSHILINVTHDAGSVPRALRILVAVALTTVPLLSQSASLRGRVTDESGAVVPSATVTLNGPSGATRTTTATGTGVYLFTGLPPGDYTVAASAPNLAQPQPVKIALRGGERSLDLRLKVASTAQQVTVKESPGPGVTADPANNASTLVLKGEDLRALADDPDDLASDLQALAGPSAGPDGGSVFVDGFSGGQIPPKESIREVRINQNPFSPEYDTIGYGRIEIFTKPGTDKFRGTGFYNFGDSVWNSRNPYAAEKAPFELKEYGGNVSGPLNRRASFTLDLQRHSIDNGAIINGSTLDPSTLAIVNPFTAVFRIPQRRVIVSPRLDYQIDANNTLTARYSFTRAEIADSGVGGFNLVSQGYNTRLLSQLAQIAETAVLGSSAVNELRFQFFRVGTSSIAATAGPEIQVLGAFTGGGAPVGQSFDTQNNYEFQNYTSLIHASHTWRFGVRLRGATDANVSPLNFAGTFTFGGGLAPELDANNQAVLDAAGQPVLINIDSIERYRRTLLFGAMGLPAARIRSLGGGATQFAIGAGEPSIFAGQFDLGAFAGDDWRIRPNLTLSLGLRYETQTNIHDGRDFAPRLGLAWAPGAGSGRSRAKGVLRAGFGMFYDRFPLAATLAAMRYNGVVQRQYVVANPDFYPTVPPIASLAGAGTVQSVQEASSTLRAPYIMQSALSYEYPLPFNTTVAVTYANSHGVHLLRSEDINAPLPGTYDPATPGSGLFPYGVPGPIQLMESSGLYNQNQLIANVNSKVNGNVSLFGSYVYNRAFSDTDGLATFPARPYSFAGEYGPAATDIHNRVTVGGSIVTKWGLRFSPLFTASSGPPFDITTGGDLYGDTLFNARPGIATDPAKPGVIATPYGLLDPNPSPGERLVPRNFGRGPGLISLNLRLGRTFLFGSPREAPSAATPPEPRYNLTVSVSIRNLLNHNNPGPIVGDIASPLFGEANQPFGVGVLGGTGFSESANNRRLELQTRFTF